jgi:hypothetical protein
VGQRTGTGGKQSYATTIAGLWDGLARALSELDALAAEPEALSAERLPSLQYALHSAGERIAGLTPPEGAEAVHEELAAAVADARDATADVADTVEAYGEAAAAPLVWEWRGALFRVRLARHRLLHPEPLAADQLRPSLPSPRRAAMSVALICTAAVALLAGALVGHWALVAAGVLALFGGMLVQR